jgi:hypothetical protein
VLYCIYRYAQRKLREVVDISVRQFTKAMDDRIRVVSKAAAAAAGSGVATTAKPAYSCVLEAVESAESSSSFNNATSLEVSSESIDVFESRSNRGFFYVPLQDGKTLWVSLFYLKALAEKGCEPHSLPVHPQKSPIPVSAHPVGGGAAGGEAVGFLDERRKKVMRVRKVVYAK